MLDCAACNSATHLGLDNDKGFFIFGQSWGGMLGGAYATTRPRGLKRLVIGSGPASIPLYVEGVKELLNGLPPDVQETLAECEEKADTTSNEYKAAAGVWMKKHVFRLDEFPRAVLDTIENTKTDPTVYTTMCGPSEFQITGTIKDMDFTPDAHKIDVPVLLLNGRYDEASDLCVEPWFGEIPKVKWGAARAGESHGLL
ncbi:Alpha/Beta hydrolase protein [Podospora appendiculata]|uniref:Alpha/Beta hydrolase protein n=1 Tax=Podospora appendiculata TaxID=314037 RepID=A0AAE0X037_9PEZI|nr:Alpha/Beta hydrolase protein [Podospora appendiculata]